MSADPRPGMIRFNGAATAFLVTICRECDMVLPHNDEERRMQWALEHGSVGHKVEFAVDVRPDPSKPFAFITRETLQQQHQWVNQNPSYRRNPLLAQQTDNQGVSMKPAPPAAIPKDDTAPKKTTARDRRRDRRKDKQRNDT